VTNRIKICWLGRKYKKNYVCFIPFTIDGIGTSPDKALGNLEIEILKIIKALKKAKVKCNFSAIMVRKAIKREAKWRSSACKRGKNFKWTPAMERKMEKYMVKE
jgi:hypothetical protein